MQKVEMGIHITLGRRKWKAEMGIIHITLGRRTDFGSTE